MGNEIGSNDLVRSPSTYSGPFKNVNKMWEKTIWEASFSPARFVMLEVSARLDLETADLPSSCRAPSVGT